MSTPLNPEQSDSVSLTSTALNPSIKVWICHDGRAGHISQLQGLIKALSEITPLDTLWVEAKSLQFRVSNLLRPLRREDSPDIVIGAGHRTHKALLFAARAHKALSFVIMKPSLPLACFDGVICPKHDGLANSKRVLTTQGPLTKTSTPKPGHLDRNKHLIILGGPSKHFEWDEPTLVEQIQSICMARPEISWSLSNSPRTPNNFIEQLSSQKIPNLSCHHYQDKSFGPIESVLQSSAFTWITPDSMSMIYESLNAGSPTALFSLSPNKKAGKKRICRHISEILEQDLVMGYQQWQAIHNTHFYPPEAPALNEAEKAAKWLLSRYQDLRAQ